MIGETLGHYRVVEKLGQGGMGAVYLAEHQTIGRRAAIKVLRPELSQRADILQRFFNEARSTALIKHPGLVDVFDYGTDGSGSAYIVMEFLEGQSLTARIRAAAPLEAVEVAAIGRQAAGALAAAHEKGIFHRDLKPDNIFLVPDADLPFGVRVKILDFGIAKLARLTEETGEFAGLKTHTGAILGTPAYMSPEQCQSAGEVDGRSDVYSLGCVLYEMACGRVPFVRSSAWEIMAAHATEAPAAPSSIQPSVPPEMEAIILRAMAKPIERRTPSMASLKAELDAAYGGNSTRPLSRVKDADSPPGSSGAAAGRPQVSTTLGNSIGEVGSASGAPRWSVRAVSGLVAGALVLAAVGLVAVQRLTPASRVAPAGSPPGQAAGSAGPSPPPTAIEAGPPSAQSPRMLHYQLESTPRGAKVVRTRDGVEQGVTPLTLDIAAGSGPVSFELRLPDHQVAVATFAADADKVEVVRLTPARRPASRPPRRGPATNTDDPEILNPFGSDK